MSSFYVFGIVAVCLAVIYGLSLYKHRGKAHLAPTSWRDKLRRRHGVPVHRAPDVPLRLAAAVTPAVGLALVAAVAVHTSPGIPVRVTTSTGAPVTPTAIPDLSPRLDTATSDALVLRLTPRQTSSTRPPTPAPTTRLPQAPVRPLAAVSSTSRIIRPTASAAPRGGFRERVLATARAVLGTPYHYGKETPQDGFDCSGLTRWTYGRAGIVLPRVANDQMRALKTTRTPLPGDLVFFLNEGGEAYHVGIFLEPGQMIAAPKTGDYVRVEKIWTQRITYRAAA